MKRGWQDAEFLQKAKYSSDNATSFAGTDVPWKKSSKSTIADDAQDFLPQD